MSKVTVRVSRQVFETNRIHRPVAVNMAKSDDYCRLLLRGTVFDILVRRLHSSTWRFNKCSIFNLKNFMKQIISTLSFVTALIFMSCSNEKAEVKKEVIVVPAKPAVVVKKPTTIVLDKNGAKVETKKVDISVKNK